MTGYAYGDSSVLDECLGNIVKYGEALGLDVGASGIEVDVVEAEHLALDKGGAHLDVEECGFLGCHYLYLDNLHITLGKDLDRPVALGEFKGVHTVEVGGGGALDTLGKTLYKNRGSGDDLVGFAVGDGTCENTVVGHGIHGDVEGVILAGNDNNGFTEGQITLGGNPDGH